MDKIVLKDGTEYEILESASIDNIKIEVDEFGKIKGIDEKFSSDNLKEVKFKVNDEITGSYINLVRQNISFIQKTVNVSEDTTSKDSNDIVSDIDSSTSESEVTKDISELASENISANETSTEALNKEASAVAESDETNSTPLTKVIYVVTISLRESTEVELRLLALEEKTDSINASQEVTSNTVNEILTDIIPSLIVGADE